VGDGDHEPHEAAPRRGATLSRRRRLALALALAALAALWSAGGVLLDRHLHERDEIALAVVAGDRLLSSTLPAAPTTGWASATARGRVDAGGRRWLVRPAGRLGEEAVWALLPEGAVARNRSWLWALLAGSFAIAAGGVTLALVRRGRPRSASVPLEPSSGDARPEPELAARSRELAALHAAALTMGSRGDLASVAEQMLDVVLTASAMPVGMVYRLDDAGQRLVCLASRGLTADETERLRERSLEGSHTGEAVRTGRVVVTDLASSPLVVDPVLRQAIADGRFHTQLALPIVADGRAWGVLALVSAEPRPFDDNVLTLLQGVALQIGLAVGRAALLAETQEKTRRQATLAHLAQGLTATLSGDQVLQRVVDAAVELLGGDIARLWLLDEDSQALSLGAAAGSATAPEGLRTLPVGEGLVGLVVARRTALAIADVQADARVRNTDRLQAEAIASAAGVPLRLGERVIGALAVGSRTPRAYPDEELALLQSLADQAAIAIDNARLFFVEQTRRAYLHALLEINTKIGALAPTETLLTSIAEEAARLLAVDNAGFRLLDGDHLVVAGLAGTASQTMVRPRLRIDESLSGRVMTAGCSLVLDLDERAGAIAEHVAADRRLGYTKFLGVPLKVGDRAIGVLTFRARRAFTPRDQELAEAFAGQAAVALEHSRLYREARRQAARMRALADLGRVLSETLDPDVVGQRAADSIRALLGARSAALYRMTETGAMVALTVSEGSTFAWTGELPPGVGLAGLAAGERRAHAAPDVLADPSIPYDESTRRAVAANPDRALMGVPLIVRDRVFGALVVVDRTGRVFDAEDIRLAEAFADQAALALENARLYAETTRRRREAEELAGLNRTLTESLDVSDVVGRTVESVLPLFGAGSSVLRLMQPDGSLVALGVGGRSRDGVGAGHVLAPGVGVLGRAIAEGRAVWSADVLTDPEVSLSDDLRAAVERSGARAVLAVPLRVKAAVIGALGVHDARGRRFTEDEAHLLQALADQAALALENARLFSLERARRRQVAALAEIEREFAAELDTERLPGLIVERAARLFDGEGAIYLLADGDRLVRHAWTAEGPGPVAVTPGTGLVGTVMTERQGLIVNDYPRSPLARPEFLSHRVRHAMAQPVVLGGRVHAVVAMSRAEGGEPFLADDLALLESFAAQAGIALENSRLYHAAETRAARLRTLARLNHLVTSSLDTAEVLTSIAEATVQIMNAPFVGFWLADEGARTLRLQAASDAGPAGEVQGLDELRFGEGAVGWVAAERRSLTIDDIFVDGRFVARTWAAERGLRSLFSTPILDHERLLGVLVMIRERPFRFGPDDEDLLQSFSAQAAAAIRNARLYEQARRYAERLRALEEVNRLVSSSLNVEEVLQNLARAIAQFFDAPFVSIWAYEARTERLQRALTFGDPELAAELADEVALGEGAVGWVVQSREAILWTDASVDPRFPDTPTLWRRGLRWMTVYPIAIGDRMLGAFAVHRASALPVTPETAPLMGSLAAQAAIALENARLYSETSRRLTQTRALLEVAEILSTTLDSRRLLRQVAVKVAQLCRVDRCTVELWEDGRVVPLMSQFADGREVPGMWERFQTAAAGPPGTVPAHARVLETHQPLLIEDCATSPLAPPAWAATFGSRACLVVPMLRQDRVIGVVTLDYCERPGAFQDWQRELGQAIAGQIALALENSRLFAEAQERLRETRTLLTVGQVLSQPGPTDILLRGVAAEVGRAFGADTVGVYLADERRQALVPEAGYHVPRDLLNLFLDRPIRLDRSPALTEAFREGRTVSSPDGRGDAGYDAEWTRPLPPYSMLFAPTLAHGLPVGGLFLVWWHTGRAFPPAEVRLLDGVAAQVGLAMENIELARQTQRKLAETETLLEVSRAVSSTLDVQSLVRLFLRQVAATFAADTVGLWMVDESGQWLTPLAGYRVPPAWLEALRDVRFSLVDHPIYAEAARTRHPVYSADVVNDPRFPPVIRERAAHRCQLFVPVVSKDRMIGGFAVVWREQQRRLGPSELALLEAIANQAGIAIENARLFEENRRRVEELSVLHELSRAVTGELDRAALLEALRGQLGRVVDTRNMLVVLQTDEGDAMEVALRITDGERDDSEPRRYLARDMGLASTVLESGQPLRTDDYAGECARRGVQPLPHGLRTRHWLGVPLTARDRVLGMLALRSNERPFSEAEEHLLLNTAHLAALALSSVRLYEERTRAYGELAAAQDQLVRTEKLRALGEMASGVAHDFNNLLAAVLGRAQLLLRRVQDPQQRQWLQVIERSALDGAQTVKRLQDFTRVRRDQPLVPLDVNQVIRDALEITQMRWKEEPAGGGLALEVRTDLGAVPSVLGDAAELREAMTNLILNALDAMPEGGTLTLSTAQVDSRVEIAVADTGVGMSAEVRDKVFDPFFTTKGPQGTGLGLSMTYGIVSRHGGSITVDSEPGRGSTFRLSLPAGAGGPPAEPVRAAAPAPVRPLRCLVVDDEPDVRAVVADILESAGHVAVQVADGREAIARFTASPFDLVVTDLAMPGVSGWQVARAVKQVAPRVPVFLVTGFGVELTAEERRAHDVDLVLVKPLQIQEVLDAVAEVARARPPAR
jgi:GAF domain-containing protein